MIPLTKPYITDEIRQEVLAVLDSGYLTEGPVTAAFEVACREFIGCEHAIAVSNCTVGLEMALRTAGIGQGDEVIVPDYTYPATASVVATVGARIVVVDITPETMLIDYDAVDKAVTSRTKAVIPVSLFGNPLDYSRLNALKEKHDILVIEDAACALGAEYDGAMVGTLADISVFSLHPRKFITTGEGGLITTGNSSWAEWLNSYKHFGMAQGASRAGTVFEIIGSNHKLSNIQAAVGLVQMRHVDEFLATRRRLAARYYELLTDQPGVSLPVITDKGSHSYQSCCIFVDGPREIIRLMREKDIEVQIGTYSLHMHPAFDDDAICEIRGELTGSRYAYEHCLVLPLYHEMADDEQRHVIDVLGAMQAVPASCSAP